MPLNKEAIKRLDTSELYAVFSADAFSGQREELLETLQRKSKLEYDAFKGTHQSEGCKVVYIVRGYSDSPFVDIDLNRYSYKHWSFWCRRHGVSSETIIDMSFPEEPSKPDAEKSRYDFIQHIIGEKSERESVVQAWNKFEDYIVSWAKVYEGLHYLSDYSGEVGIITPFLERVQLGVKTLNNQGKSDENSVALGLFSQLVFGVDHNFGVLLEDLTSDEKGKAILFCKEMVPRDFLSNNLLVLENANWDNLTHLQ